MKTVLLPTDFSDNAFNAIKYAIEFYRGSEVKFILANAFEPPHAGASVLLSLEDLMREEIEDELRELRQKIEEEYTSERLDIVNEAVYGGPITMMKEMIHKHRVNEIVMGTQGATGLKQVFIGTVAAAAVREIKIPIVIVPSNHAFQSPQNIMLATDFHTLEPGTLSPLVELIKARNSKLLIFHASENLEDTEQAEKNMRAKLDGVLNGIEYTLHFEQNTNIEEGIADFIDSNKIDMLTMVHHDHSFWDRLFYGSVTKRMAMDVNIPLLALRG